MAILVNVTREGRIPPKAVIHTPESIENCNMFNIDALEKSLKYMTVKNYWSLYNLQKKKTGIVRYDIPFREFTQEFRLPTETQNKMYSKRYVYYIPVQFIESSRRREFKNSEFYNKAVDFTTVSKHPSLYKRNFMVFIGGRFISTVDILPLEDKTAVIIDVASSNDTNGIPLSKYREYKDNNEMVTILLVPNYTFSRLISNRYAVTNSDYIIPFSKFNSGENIIKNNLLLINTTGKGTVSLRRPTIKYKTDYINKRFVFTDEILNEFSDTNISDSDDMISSYDFLCLNFSELHSTFQVPNHGYFKVSTKMPCPREQMLVFTILSNGNIIFDSTADIQLFYPNIYHISGGVEDEGKTYLVYCFYDKGFDEDEEYFNQISLYEEYVDVLGRYIEGNVPKVLEEWYPAEYHYGIDDYDNNLMCLHMPNTLIYKMFKMHDSIKNDPWSLCAYLKFLLCPNEKYYVDMAKLKLSSRVRTDTYMEPIVNGTNYVFEEEHYVFAMNRRFLKKSRYDFRIWIDGLFLNKMQYHMELGLDYYYIYIPTRLVTESSIMEIERHKLFDFYTEITINSKEECVELLLDNELVTAYVRDLYVVNIGTNQYVDKGDVRITKYSHALDKWIDIDTDSFAIMDDTVKLYITNDDLLGVPLRVGIHKGASMSTGEMYDKDEYRIGDSIGVSTTNHGNYKSSDYRVFNNGKLLLPPQWQTDWSETYGGLDTCQTSWALTKGDQVTIDHVPCSFRVVHYQADIPKNGLIDVDGKLNLPVSLKWYDIYLNGRKLNHKNITIISPTKFYVNNVSSTRHLIIFDRNRDNDVFYLDRVENKDIYDIHKNHTIIDKLIHAELGDILDEQRDPIDNTEPDIGDPGVFGPKVLDAINYFLIYLKYSYIHCNYKLLSSEVKDKFGFFINEDGVMGINSNVHPSGVLYKVINCNKGVEDMDIELTNVPVETGLRELQDRFAITPLHSSNHKYALKGEFLCDPETGGTGIRHNDGTITMIDEVNRKKEHIDIFEQKLILANIGRYTIFDAQFDDTSKVKTYFRGENLLDNEILIEREGGEDIGKVALSIDTTILQKSDDDYILRWSNHDPIITVTYYTEKDHVSEQVYEQVASRLGDRCLEINSPILVISSIVINLPDNALSEDEDNPFIEDGEAIEFTKGVTLTDSTYTNPELEETPIENPDSNDDPDCICPLDETGEGDNSIEGDGGDISDSEGDEDTNIEPGDSEDVTTDEDADMYDPIGDVVDDSEFTDPMRCIVHSVLIALKEGGLII